MSLRVCSLSALSLLLVLTACDGGGNSTISTDNPVAGVPEAPTVVTKGKVPGSTGEGGGAGGEVEAADIVGTWSMSSPGTEDEFAVSYVLVLTADGKGTLTYTREGEKPMKSAATWTKSATGYQLQLSIEGDDFTATGKVSGNKLTLTAQGNDLILTRVD